MQFVIPIPAGYQLRPVLRSHGWVQLAPFLAEDPFEEFDYSDQLQNGRTVSLHVQQTVGGLQVTTDPQLTAAEVDEVSQKLRWMLGLERDLTSFYIVARDEPKLVHVVSEAHGRILRSATFFEDTIKTILTTNTAWSGTIRMATALVDLYGASVLRAAEGQAARAFPSPAALAAADVESLRSEAKLGYRAPYVSELARRVDSGKLDLEAYKTADLPTPELRKELLAIKGIGAYAAANLLMLLGRTDYIPIDSYALKVVSNEFHGGQPVTAADVEAAFESFGEWKGMAFWFWNYE